jgi:hypothetical protein
MAGERWRYIIDKPGYLEAETYQQTGFRSAAECMREATRQLDACGPGWRATVDVDLTYQRRESRLWRVKGWAG